MGFLFVSLPESNFKYSILRRLKKLFQHPQTYVLKTPQVDGYVLRGGHQITMIKYLE
jgi:hypothetical protein